MQVIVEITVEAQTPYGFVADPEMDLKIKAGVAQDGVAERRGEIQRNPGNVGLTIRLRMFEKVRFFLESMLGATRNAERHLPWEFSGSVFRCENVHKRTVALYVSLSRATRGEAVTLVGDGYEALTAGLVGDLVRDHGSAMYEITRTRVKQQDYFTRFATAGAIVAFLVRVLDERVAEQVRREESTEVTCETARNIRTFFYVSEPMYLGGYVEARTENETRIDRLLTYLTSLRDKANDAANRQVRGIELKRYAKRFPSSYRRWVVGCAMMYVQSLRFSDEKSIDLEPVCGG